ncbi:MAG: NADH-quinone oxidoreductase subunit NuoE [Deltaproteobacteria bacterium]|nr:NADH-quinone oxidoreductase subunit NuoE [Deltaproteobacteria bacterium]
MIPGAILERYDRSPDNLLSILHDLQDANERHYLTDEDLRRTADYLGLTPSFVHGVATFYTMFSLKPRGRYIIRICQSPPCYLMGSTTMVMELMRHLGVEFGETTRDGLFTLEMSSCLGVCGVAPAMMINDEVYGNLTPDRIQIILEEKRRVP